MSEELKEAPCSVVVEKVKLAFTQLDNDVSTTALEALSQSPVSAKAIATLAPAVSGSCALLSIYDPQHSLLRVACVGNSRAVLGCYNENTAKYKAIPLSEDQTGFNISGSTKTEAEHRNEPKVLGPKTGRLLGMAIRRAFGDHRWKWKPEQIETAREKLWGSAP